MTDRDTVIEALQYLTSGECTDTQFDYLDEIEAAIALLKGQETIKQKMWNALYAEEDKLEKQYAGTDKNDDWFFVYRPWLQRGFEIAIEVIAKQEGR